MLSTHHRLGVTMTRYEQGFMNKCAEYGVDPEQLIKRARMGLSTGSLKRLYTKLSPVISKKTVSSPLDLPDRNILERLFTRRSVKRTHGPSWMHQTLNWDVAPSGTPTGSTDRSFPISFISKTRLRPEGVAGAAALPLLAADIGSPDAGDAVTDTQPLDPSSSEMSPKAKALLAVLGLTGVAGAGYVAGKAFSSKKKRSRKRKDSDDND